MKPIKPRKLPPNGTIGIVSPASPVDTEKLETGVRYLEKIGYRVEIGNAVYRADGYLAGSDVDRLDDLEDMFLRKDIDAIFCSRGGYGTPRLLAKINYETIRQNPKIFVGYSDLTALQLAIFRETGLVTFSGPMVGVEFANGIDRRTEEHFWRTICDTKPLGRLEPLQEPYQIVEYGVCRGRLLVGCLSVLAGMAGTPYFPSLVESVLLFEDVGEKPYRIDHFLAQMRNAGVLKNFTGIIAGQFCDCEPPEDKPSWTLTEVFSDYFHKNKIPVISGFDYGHVDVKYTLPIGVQIRLDTDPLYIEIEDSGVI